MKNFKHWKFEQIERTFGLKRVKNHSTLTTWLNAKHTILPEEKARMLQLQNTLIDYVDVWNEMELQFHFLGAFIGLVDFQNSRYNAFLQRQLFAIIQDIEVGGRVDFMVATGKQDPYEPYFFLHEYKKEKGVDNDPLGQLLVAMLAAQTRNENQETVYGTYVIGRFWFFVVLEGKEYSVSLAYDATQEDIFDIFSILREVKVYIDKQIEKTENIKVN